MAHTTSPSLNPDTLPTWTISSLNMSTNEYAMSRHSSRQGYSYSRTSACTVALAQEGLTRAVHTKADKGTVH
jgi:hypothetical protein